MSAAAASRAGKVAAGDADAGAQGGQADRGGLADAAGAAGDQDRCPGQRAGSGFRPAGHAPVRLPVGSGAGGTGGPAVGRAGMTISSHLRGWLIDNDDEDVRGAGFPEGPPRQAQHAPRGRERCLGAQDSYICTSLVSVLRS